MKNSYKILRQIEANLLIHKDQPYTRDDFSRIQWENPVIGIFGERGVGKTTILIQKRKEVSNAFYFSADNAAIKANGLFDFVMFCFQDFGVEMFFIDEIFKYTNWKQELKNIIDSFPQIRIVFSGSSSMALYDGVIDLGRRVYDYRVYTLSFREYLKLKHHIDLPQISFNDLLYNHEKLSVEYSIPLRQSYFDEYIQMGAYPFGLGVDFGSFANLLQKTLDRIILEDLQYIRNYQTQSLDKLSKLIYFIANTTPSELSINHLSQKIGLDKNVVDNVLFLLSKIGVIHLIQKGQKLSEKVRKEYKIFLSDTNKYFVNNAAPDIGIIREAFFVSEMQKIRHIEISLPERSDFCITYKEEQYLFEIGGKNKNPEKYPKNTFIVKDIFSPSEHSHSIPLWMFGFLN